MGGEGPLVRGICLLLSDRKALAVRRSSYPLVRVVMAESGFWCGIWHTLIWWSQRSPARASPEMKIPQWTQRHQPKQLRSNVRMNTGYLACPSSRWPGADREERKEWVFVENADSSAAPAVTGQGASKKQSSQLSIESQGPSSCRPGQLEWFTRVGNLV